MTEENKTTEPVKPMPKPAKPRANRMPVAKKGLTTQSELHDSAAKKITKGFYKPGDPLAIRNRDSRFAYRWINAKNVVDNGGIDPRGWELDKDPSRSGADIKSDNVLDGCKRVGDLVLAKMPIETHEARKEYYANKKRQRDEIISAKNKIRGVGGTAEFKSQRGGQVVHETGD